ncbi:MAG: BamA/TamA family outer membrane protein [Bacteroidetes bacterium]|nr:BamA/TamA family outer membrane protein [Bacteroidota bacterium]
MLGSKFLVIERLYKLDLIAGKHGIIQIFIAVLILVSVGCSTSRHLQENEALLHKNTIKHIKDHSEKHKKAYKKSALQKLLKQKPNDRFFGTVRLKLRLYNAANKGLETRFKWWVKNRLGEPPVIYDSSYAHNSAKLMTLYLKNKGHFGAEVKYEASVKNKKTTITYWIDHGPQYRIRTIFYPDDGTPAAKRISKASEKSLIQIGDSYDVDVLQKERKRITINMRNSGFFYFHKDNIYFEIDSSLESLQVDIYIKIHINENIDEISAYKLNAVYLFPGNSVCKLDTNLKYDTIRVGEYYIVTSDTNQYKWDILLNAVFLKEGQRFYYQKNYKLTLARLTDLGLFNFVNIIFTNSVIDSVRMLDCYICLEPGKKQEMSVELEGNTGGETRVGIGAKYTYRNKNLFRGAEILTFNANTGVESQVSEGDPFLNTLELSSRLNLLFPKFLLPIVGKRFPQSFNPKTKFSGIYSFQKRPDLTLLTANLSFGYDWKEFETKRHILSPITLNYVKAENFSSELQDLLKRNPTIAKSLEDQLILGGSYTFIYNDQLVSVKRDFWFFRGNIDLSGNSTKLLNSIYNSATGKTGSFKIFSLDYAHFTKLDADLRRYVKLSNSNVIAIRLAAGFAYAIGDSAVLPYVKQFYVGGSNSIRAWRIRTLGPGSFDANEVTNGNNGSTVLDQTGDIKLESSLEYRFDIYSLVKGAVFLDAGNIWTVREDTARTGSILQADQFTRDIDLGGGAGIRLDFSFIILRIDLGIKLRDPSFPVDERWVIKDIGNATFRNFNIIGPNDYPYLNLSIAIGSAF